MSIADWIRAERTALKLTRAELELLSGVSIATIDRIEAGNSGVALGNIVSVLEVLGGKLEVKGGGRSHCAGQAGYMG